MNKTEWLLKIALHKNYFDTGFGTLNYLKYPLLLLGFAIPEVRGIILIAFLYATACYFLGWWWLNFGMQDAENEINNRFNPFCKQVRKRLRIKKVEKL